MKPFSPASRCPKCWGKEVSTMWWAQRDKRPSHSWAADAAGTNEEHIARKCVRCGYLWAELPMDLVDELQQLGSVKEE